VLDSLQLTAKHGVSTPVNWKPGENVVVPAAMPEDEVKEEVPKWAESIEALSKARLAPEITRHVSSKGGSAKKGGTRGGLIPPLRVYRFSAIIKQNTNGQSRLEKLRSGLKHGRITLKPSVLLVPGMNLAAVRATHVITPQDIRRVCK
jgi:hypothetical protein